MAFIGFCVSWIAPKTGYKHHLFSINGLGIIFYYLMLRKGFTRQVENHTIVIKTGLVRNISYYNGSYAQTSAV